MEKINDNLQQANVYLILGGVFAILGTVVESKFFGFVFILVAVLYVLVSLYCKIKKEEK